jgi:hypothetical protein
MEHHPMLNLELVGGIQMDIGKILDELRQERTQIEEAILSIERLAVGQGKRRGRPPAWIALARSAEPKAKRRGRPPSSKKKNTEASA